MAIFVNTNQLSTVFGLLAKATDQHPQNPVLGNVLFNFLKNRLHMFATDLHILVTTSLDVINENQEGEEAITLPARTFLEIISTMDDELSLTLRKDGGGVAFSDGSFKGVLHGISSDAFPPVDIALEGDNFSLERKVMLKAIDQVNICASKDDARPVLQGVLFEIKDKHLTCAATDGCMVAVMQAPNIVDLPDQSIIIPATSLKVVSAGLKLFIPDDITVWKNGEFGVFTMNDCTIRTDLISGNYPDFTSIIPQSFKTKVAIKKSSLLMAVRQVLALGLGNPSMVFNLEGEKLKTFSPESASDEISSRQELEATIDGPNLKIALNPKYLKAILENYSGEDVVMEMNTDKTPAKLSFPDDPDLFYIIMPMYL